MVKTCTKCKESKPLTEFYRHKHSSDGRAWSCKKCHQHYFLRFRKKTKKKRAKQDWERHLKSNYGITGEMYKEMLTNQGGVCAICKSDNTGRRGAKRFSVDHCHNTGKVRGLLCHKCNRDISGFERLRNYADTVWEYLDKDYSSK